MGQRKRSIARWVGNLAGAVLVIALCALIIGTGYQYLENRRDLQAHPAPGRLLDVGGHRLHLWCTGTGAPVVVLEAGGGGNVLEWSRVQPEVAKTTRVCSYDRAGFGWSDLGPNPRSAARIVSELHTLLQAADVPAPYVLTAHSIGGLYVRLYASTYPTEVAAMVLVDTTHEDFQRRMPADAGARMNPLLLNLVAALHEFITVVGFARLTGVRFASGHGVSPEALILAEGIKVKTTVPFADGSESLATEESSDEVRRTRQILNIPLVVVTRGRYDRIQTMPQEKQEQIKRAWGEMQADLVTLSSQGTRVVAANSDHYVHVRQPDVVIDAIRTVVTKARAR